jgi:hypothetical protein
MSFFAFFSLFFLDSPCLFFFHTIVCRIPHKISCFVDHKNRVSWKDTETIFRLVEYGHCIRAVYSHILAVYVLFGTAYDIMYLRIYMRLSLGEKRWLPFPSPPTNGKNNFYFLNPYLPLKLLSWLIQIKKSI